MAKDGTTTDALLNSVASIASQSREVTEVKPEPKSAPPVAPSGFTLIPTGPQLIASGSAAAAPTWTQIDLKDHIPIGARYAWVYVNLDHTSGGGTSYHYLRIRRDNLTGTNSYILASVISVGANGNDSSRAFVELGEGRTVEYQIDAIGGAANRYNWQIYIEGYMT